MKILELLIGFGIGLAVGIAFTSFKIVMTYIKLQEEKTR